MDTKESNEFSSDLVDKYIVDSEEYSKEQRSIMEGDFDVWSKDKNITDEEKQDYLDTLNDVDFTQDPSTIKEQLKGDFTAWASENEIPVTGEEIDDFVKQIGDKTFDTAINKIKQRVISGIEDVLLTWIEGTNFKWEDGQTCGVEGENGGDGILNTLKTFLHYKNSKFWYLFFGVLYVLIIGPTLIKLLAGYNNNDWDTSTRFLAKLPLSPEDVSLTLINIILFVFVSLGLFYFVLSNDVTRILDNNLELYITIVKTNPELRERLLSTVKGVIDNNQVSFDNYQNWKDKCNKEYDFRPLFYAGVIGAILVVFLLYIKYATSYDFEFNWTYVFSIIMIIFVFTTELYMLFFVFTKIAIVGESELPHNLLFELASKLEK